MIRQVREIRFQECAGGGVVLGISAEVAVDSCATGERLGCVRDAERGSLLQRDAPEMKRVFSEAAGD